MRLLLIEDDHMIADSVLRTVRRQGDAIDWARNGHEARLSLSNDVYDLILLDLGLPQIDGLSVMWEYRKNGGIAPVVVITARDAIEERIICLDAGADDFLVKPFDLGELSARMRAIARRRTGRAQPLFTHGALKLDPAAHVAWLGDAELPLIAKEFSILKILIEEPNHVFSRTQLEDSLYGWGQEIGSNAIEVHIHGLRRKLGAHVVVTIRGVGYRLARAEAIVGQDAAASAAITPEKSS